MSIGIIIMTLLASFGYGDQSPAQQPSVAVSGEFSIPTMDGASKEAAYTLQAPRDTATGQSSGKRQHGEVRLEVEDCEGLPDCGGEIVGPNSLEGPDNLVSPDSLVGPNSVVSSGGFELTAASASGAIG